jgi:hypothetical protein
MPADRQDVGIALIDNELDAEQIDQLSLQLREELRQSDIDSVEYLTAGQAPPHTKAIDIIAFGGLLVTIAESVGALSSMLGTIQNWLSRRGKGAVKVQIGDDILELSNVSDERQQDIIDAFLARHGA